MTKQLHFLHNANIPFNTACGRNSMDVPHAEFLQDVTCLVCLKSIEAAARTAQFNRAPLLKKEYDLKMLHFRAFEKSLSKK